MNFPSFGGPGAQQWRPSQKGHGPMPNGSRRKLQEQARAKRSHLAFKCVLMCAVVVYIRLCLYLLRLPICTDQQDATHENPQGLQNAPTVNRHCAQTEGVPPGPSHLQEVTSAVLLGCPAAHNMAASSIVTSLTFGRISQQNQLKFGKNVLHASSARSHVLCGPSGHPIFLISQRFLYIFECPTVAPKSKRTWP